jgi:hypothetical protein
MAELNPVFRPAGQPKPRRASKHTHERECPTCGGAITTPIGHPLPPHNQYVITPNGPQQGDTPCDGHQHATTRTKEQP